VPEPLPADSTDLTPAWLTTALSPRHPGVRVAAVEVLDATERTNHHLRLGLTYDAQAGAPDTLFCKLPPRDPAHRTRIGAGAMGAREVHFYNEVAPSLSLRVPGCSFAAADPDGSFVMLLEDLVARGAAISDGSWAVPGKLAGGALAELAELHVRYEDPARLASVAPWAASQRGKTPDFVIQTLRHVIDHCADQLNDAYLAIAALYIDHGDAIEAAWDAGPRTLIHGDAHIGNLFLDGDRVGFLDWGMAKIGTPMRDVSFFLTMGVEPAGRRRDERDLVQHYLDARRALGGSAIPFEDAWRAHRLHAAYGVIASFLSLVPPYNSEARRMFTSSFRARAMAAIDDLDSVGALREAGIAGG
jgi:aminoglycoside/choline kinase family phosphotransferase